MPGLRLRLSMCAMQRGVTTACFCHRRMPARHKFPTTFSLHRVPSQSDTHEYVSLTPSPPPVLLRLSQAGLLARRIQEEEDRQIAMRTQRELSARRLDTNHTGTEQRRDHHICSLAYPHIASAQNRDFCYVLLTTLFFGCSLSRPCRTTITAAGISADAAKS